LELASNLSRRGTVKIAIDFDGVISDYQGYKGKGVFEKPVPGVADAISELKQEGHQIIIFTSRSEERDIKEYLELHDIPFDEINRNPAGTVKGLSKKKVCADVYIDDNAMAFNGSWPNTLRLLKYHQRTSARHPHDLEFLQAVEKLVATKLDGTKKYGSTAWATLGSKGIFVDINRKYQRLKKFIWNEEVEVCSERLEDTCIDLAAYALFMYMAIKEEERKDEDG
jgi:hypothetical protein